MMTLEEIALEEFKKVGDDGLFPNHTDQDIWVAGFIAAMEYTEKNNKKNENSSSV